VAFVRFQDGASLVLQACWAAHIAQSRFSSVLVGTEGGAITDPPTLYKLCDNKKVVDSEITDLPNVNAYEAELTGAVAR
jgi:hypothetical protein